MTTSTHPRTRSDFFAEEARRAVAQERVNETFARHGAVEAQAVIRLMAALDHVAFPHYHGHWTGDEWTLARCTQKIETKGGVRADVGDIVLFRYEPGLGFTQGRKVIYSVRGQIDCVVDYGIEPLEGWTDFFRRAR